MVTLKVKPAKPSVGWSYRKPLVASWPVVLVIDSSCAQGTPALADPALPSGVPRTLVKNSRYGSP